MNSKLSKSTTIVLFICAIAVLVLFSFIPLISRLIMPFKDYDILKGFANSPWVGFTNFKRLFTSFHFSKLMLNTLMQNLMTILVAVPIAAITIYSLARIKYHKIRTLLSFTIAIPALIPSVLIGNFIVFTYGKEILNMNYTLLYGMIHGIKLASFAVIASWAMSLDTEKGTRGDKGVLTHTMVLVAIMVLVALSRTMSTDMDFANIVSNPIIFEKSDTLSTFIYRMSFMNMQLGQSTAAWTFKFIIELVVTMIAIGFTFLLLKRLNPGDDSNVNEGKHSSTPFIVISSLIALIMLALSILVIIPKTFGSLDGMEISYITPMLVLFIYLITSLLSAFFGALLSFPFALKKPAITLIYIAVLIPCLYSLTHFHEFLMYKQLGMVNTLLPLIIGSLSAVWMIPFYAIYLYRPDALELKNTGDYIKSVFPVALIMAVIQFTISWGGMTRPMIYICNPQRGPISLLIKYLSMEGQQNLALNLMLVVPILILWGVVGCVCAFKKCNVNK